jgi:hypothetical protein
MVVLLDRQSSRLRVVGAIPVGRLKRSACQGELADMEPTEYLFTPKHGGFHNEYGGPPTALLIFMGQPTNRRSGFHES